MKENLLKIRAIKLRKAGYSYNMINARLGISKSTLSNWFKDKPFYPNHKVLRRIQFGPIKSAEKRHNQKVKEILKLQEIGFKELGILTKRDLWMLGIGLYIGEGAKSHETIRIINSNPNVIRLAIKWFKDVCGITNQNITIAIHLYPDNNINECLKFWKSVTKLPTRNFRKTQIDTRKNKTIIKRGKLPYGTVHITLISKGNPELGVRLYRKMSGWINGAFSQI